MPTTHPGEGEPEGPLVSDPVFDVAIREGSDLPKVTWHLICLCLELLRGRKIPKCLEERPRGRELA